MLGRAALVADPEASQRRPRDSVRVGALEQLVPGLLVEAAQAPLVPPAAVVERDAPDEVLPCLLYTSPSPRDRQKSRMPSSA